MVRVAQQVGRQAGEQAAGGVPEAGQPAVLSNGAAHPAVSEGKKEGFDPGLLTRAPLAEARWGLGGAVVKQLSSMQCSGRAAECNSVVKQLSSV